MERSKVLRILSRERETVEKALQECADGSDYVSPDGIITAMDYVEALSYAICAVMATGSDTFVIQ